jgi:hypothetical protein
VSYLMMIGVRSLLSDVNRTVRSVRTTVLPESQYLKAGFVRVPSVDLEEMNPNRFPHPDVCRIGIDR